MKHTIIKNQRLDSHHSMVTVNLKPDSDAEKIAIKNLQNLTATQDERDLVENYLHFNLGLGNYSVVESLNQTDNLFVLKIFA
jgi:hypothetical protein